MYAVVEGRVRISVAGRIVERLGPGGVFGEVALIDPAATRIADAARSSRWSRRAPTSPTRCSPRSPAA